MRPSLPLTLFALLVALCALAGCKHQLPFDVSLAPTASPALDADSSLAGLTGSLRANGAVVRVSGAISQPFLSVTGTLVDVGAADVQVYAYPDANAAHADAARISADGTTIQTDAAVTSVEWAGVPHFYLSDRLLVVYVGADADVLALLAHTLGSPFAGESTQVGSAFTSL